MTQDRRQRPLGMEAVSFPYGWGKPNLGVDDALPPEAGKRSIQEPAEIFGRLEKIQEGSEMGQELTETAMGIQRKKALPVPLQPVPAG
jgi:hypothetical protein